MEMLLPAALGAGGVVGVYALYRKALIPVGTALATWWGKGKTELAAVHAAASQASTGLAALEQRVVALEQHLNLPSAPAPAPAPAQPANQQPAPAAAPAA